MTVKHVTQLLRAHRGGALGLVSLGFHDDERPCVTGRANLLPHTDGTELLDSRCNRRIGWRAIFTRKPERLSIVAEDFQSAAGLCRE
jgi:hypothetical protein